MIIKKDPILFLPTKLVTTIAMINPNKPQAIKRKEFLPNDPSETSIFPPLSAEQRIIRNVPNPKASTRIE